MDMRASSNRTIFARMGASQPAATSRAALGGCARNWGQAHAYLRGIDPRQHATGEPR